MQSPLLRVPLADGTLISTPGGALSDELVPSLLTASDGGNRRRAAYGSDGAFITGSDSLDW